jgi:hypothetical protein
MKRLLPLQPHFSGYRTMHFDEVLAIGATTTAR